MDDPAVTLKHKDYLKVDRHYEEAAVAAHLLYVKDTDPGISRTKKGKDFIYHFSKKPVRDEKQLRRIRRLVIPPAWVNVWICPVENGHIQATRFDQRNRKQYRYHELWNRL